MKKKKNKLAVYIALFASLFIAIVIYFSKITHINIILGVFSIIIFWLLCSLSSTANELKKIQNEYKKNSEQLHDFLKTSPNWIFYKDKDSKVTGCNDVLCDFFKLNRKEIIGRTLLEYFSEEERKKIIEQEKILFKTKSIVEYNLKVENENEVEYFHIIKHPLLDENDEIYGTSAIGINNTEIVLTAKCKELYTETLAHDFKNPIVAQYNALELLKSKNLGELNDSQLALIDQILSSCKFLEEMINTQLNTYKHRILNYQLEPSLFSVNNFLNSYINEIMPILKGRNIHIKINFQNNDMKLLTDKILFSRIIKNILFNAFTNTMENTTFTLNLEENDKDTIFTIENYGLKGRYNQKSLHELFNRFAITKEKFRQVGIGIGLYFAKKATAILDGDLKIKLIDSDIEHLDKYKITISLPKDASYLKDKIFIFK